MINTTSEKMKSPHICMSMWAIHCFTDAPFSGDCWVQDDDDVECKLLWVQDDGAEWWVLHLDSWVRWKVCNVAQVVESSPSNTHRRGLLRRVPSCKCTNDWAYMRCHRPTHVSRGIRQTQVHTLVCGQEYTSFFVQIQLFYLSKFARRLLKTLCRLIWY